MRAELYIHTWPPSTQACELSANMNDTSSKEIRKSMIFFHELNASTKRCIDVVV